jgi:hypothetical protein
MANPPRFGEVVMAIEVFWDNVRHAARVVVPRGLMTDVAEVPPPAVLEGGLRATTPIWRRGASVVGYAEADFDFLPPQDREKLTEAVQGFKGALATDAPADPDKPDEAAKTFATILGILNFYRYADSLAFRLGKQVETLAQQRGLPEVVRELRFSTSDPSGDLPVLNVTAVLKEEDLKTEAKFLEMARLVRAKLEPVTEEVAPDWFAHIMCRTDKPLTEYELRPYEDEAVTATKG